jgi:transcriptional regulator with XRE-family HTH domain
MVLYRLRKQAGLTAEEAARQLGVSPSTITRGEKGERGVNRDDLAALLTMYRAPRALRNALLRLHAESHKPGLLDRHEFDVHEDLEKWIDFEQDAIRIINYQPLLIPGLLQTFPYARALFDSGDPRLTEEEKDERVTARIARQAWLRGPGRAELEIVLHEAALHQRVGSAKVMRDQLGYLVEVSFRAAVSIRVIPHDVGAHPGMDGPFVIMDYRDMPSLVHLENKVASLYLEEESDANAYRLAYEGLLTVAHPPERSVDLISKIAAGMA